MKKFEIDGFEVMCPAQPENIKGLILSFKKEQRNYDDPTSLIKYQNNKVDQMLYEWSNDEAMKFREIYNDLYSRTNLKSSPKEKNEYAMTLKEWTTIIVFASITCLIGYGVYLYFSGKEERELKAKAKSEYYQVVRQSQEAVEKILSDPDSAKFKDQIYNCGYVNAKNSFGGYVGYKRYVVVFNQAYIEGLNGTSTDMTNLWDSACPK